MEGARTLGYQGWVAAPVAVRVTWTQAGHCSQSSLLGGFSAFSIRICVRLPSQSPHATVPSMKVSGEPNLSAKSSPVTGPALLHAPPENFLQLGALSSGFQGAEGGDHLQHVCDLRNMGLTAGTGSPQAWGHGKMGS